MNIDHAQREFDLYRKDEHEARAILDLAAEEGRATTAEEDERFEALLASAEAHKARSEKIIKTASDADDLDALIRSRIGDAADPEPAPRNGGDRRLVDVILAAQAHIRGASDAPFSTVTLNATADEEKVRTISNFGNGTSLWTADFATQVAVYARTVSPWVQFVNVITADNGRTLTLPNLSADPTGYSPGEGTAINAADATLGTASITPVSYKALNYITAEAEEDEVIGYLPLIARSQGRSIGLMAGSAHTATVLAAGTNGGTATGLSGGGTATFFGYEDLIDLKFGAAAPYRAVGVWVMSNGAIKKAKKFTDTQGQYLWQPAIALGTPPTLDGTPVYEDPYLAAPASATKSVLFVDPSAIVIKQVPVRVAVSTEYAFNLDNVALRSVYRAGAAVVDVAGVRYLVSANT